MPLNLKSMITPLVESLRSELKTFIAIIRLEEVMHPLKEEAYTTKLLLARVANHLENIQSQFRACFRCWHGHMVELFGPCSLARCSPVSSILSSLVVACTPVDSLLFEDTCVWKLLILSYTTWPQVSLLRRFTNRRTKDFDIELDQKIPLVHAIEGGLRNLHCSYDQTNATVSSISTCKTFTSSFTNYPHHLSLIIIM